MFDDSKAQSDWGWKPELDIDGLVDVMIDNLKKIYADKEAGK